MNKLITGLRAIYQKLPIPEWAKGFLKDIFFTLFGFLFKGTVMYQTWKVSKKSIQTLFNRSSHKRLTLREYKEFIDYLYRLPNEQSEYYLPYSKVSQLNLNNDDVKMIAFYLPQFHPIPENDQFWGRGFTEWNNVTRAVPQYPGHHQPQLPIDLGFYDLRNPEVIKRQVELAKQYGIYGFCFHYYWFGGKRLLEKPLEIFLENNKDLNFPFCLCWANENWTRRWDGQENEILIAQDHSPEDDLSLIRDLERHFQDQRYITIDDKPLLIIYRPQILPEPSKTLARWRHYCQQSGIGEIYLVGAKTFGLMDPTEIGFDAAVEFPPHTSVLPEMGSEVKVFNPNFQGKLYDYKAYVKSKNYLKDDPCLTFKTVFPGWDNSARKPDNGFICYDSNPLTYKEWLGNVLEFTKKKLPESHQYVFINAWNEWAEGAHLEPDRRYGYSFLQATANALLESRQEQAKVISVIAPAYNHQNFIEASLRSVAAQTYHSKELIIIDDCSQDNTAAIIEDLIKEDNFKQSFPGGITFIRHQDNKGAAYSINEGLSQAKGDYLTIINTDDLYQPDRLEVLLNLVQLKQSQIAFSRVEAVDEKGEILADDEQNLPHSIQKDLDLYKKNHLALFRHNTAISTGNLFFSRELFKKLGRFADYKYIHDWDFILRACLVTEPLFIKDTTYLYRLHDNNAFKALRDDHQLTTEEVTAVLSNLFNNLLAGNYSNEQIILAEIEKAVQEDYNNDLISSLWDDCKKSSV